MSKKEEQIDSSKKAGDKDKKDEKKGKVQKDEKG
jgi:hypothetical protein